MQRMALGFLATLGIVLCALVGEGTALDIETGLFTPISPWSTALKQSDRGVTVTRRTTGFKGITVASGSGSIFHTTLGNNISKYLLFGSGPSVLLLESGRGPGSVRRNVSMVDFTGPSPKEKPVFLSTSSSTAVNEPVVHRSSGKCEQTSTTCGTAFLIWSSSGTQIQNLAIRRSDTGAVICAGPPPFMPTGEIKAESTSTHLIIHFSSSGKKRTQRCPKP